MFPISSNEGIYQGNFTFSAQQFKEEEQNKYFYTQIDLRRRVKQRFDTYSYFCWCHRGAKHSSSEGRRKQKSIISGFMQFL